LRRLQPRVDPRHGEQDNKCLDTKNPDAFSRPGLMMRIGRLWRRPAWRSMVERRSLNLVNADKSGAEFPAMSTRRINGQANSLLHPDRQMRTEREPQRGVAPTATHLVFGQLGIISATKLGVNGDFDTDALDRMPAAGQSIAACRCAGPHSASAT